MFDVSYHLYVIIIAPVEKVGEVKARGWTF